MSFDVLEFENQLDSALARAFKNAIEAGFLYKNTKIDVSNVVALVPEKRQEFCEHKLSKDPFKADPEETVSLAQRRVARDSARRRIEEYGGEADDIPLDFSFKVPSVETWCAQCKAPTHHDYVPREVAKPVTIQEAEGKSTFVLTYRCQKCKRSYVSFMIHRNGLNLSLAGRSVPFFASPPKEVPENLKEVYSDAIQAAACNDFPAAFYHWRTLIEHLMKSTLGIALDKEMRGEDLTKEYNAKSDPYVRDKTALGPMLSICSQHLHARTGDATELEIVRQTIEAHLKLIATIKSIPQLKQNTSNLKPPVNP